ncbi:type 1 fimbrial protein [Klebsiella sp. RHBSTW-00484]|uniref:fimbrial protein n=1 Tax=unclassified Klebsiella TaxID=2608929 RepID=UPI0015E577D6|nr:MULTISPECIES: fimbrial protein [unclassified Klebsiella]MBA7847385.1 type 1 fimbrial protein [Klebsiella sp. RHBSTW-00465]QLO36726.1 type 1 fimbrial protein [Klebsiella sp. RHBSTW-00484]QLT76245.1 type 1 fimbrial protein [Klebsiella sp. RHBSTW-00464]
MKRIPASAFSGLLACLISSSAIAWDGALNFEGEAVQSTCVFDGISVAGGTPSMNPVIQLPDVSAEVLADGEIAGETTLSLHFRDCVLMEGENTGYPTFHTDNVSSDGSLYMPTNTPDSAKNVGFQITNYSRDGAHSGIQRPNYTGNSYAAWFAQTKGDLINDLYRVSYRKVPGSGAVVPGKMNASLTYNITYY